MRIANCNVWLCCSMNVCKHIVAVLGTRRRIQAWLAVVISRMEPTYNDQAISEQAPMNDVLHPEQAQMSSGARMEDKTSSQADNSEHEFEDEEGDVDSDAYALPSDDDETLEEQDEDGETSEEFTESDTESEILRKQHSLEQKYVKFQHVDVLSDFGSNEPFLVDGDALIVHALGDLWLDWHNGGQFLHHVIFHDIYFILFPLLFNLHSSSH